MNKTTKLETENDGAGSLECRVRQHGPFDNLIERMEQETGQRWDSNGGDNAALDGIFGACARALGKSGHDERDDVAAGVLIRHQTTPEYKKEQRANELMTDLLMSGVSPDDLKAVMG